MGVFKYEVDNGTVSGAFCIYQSRNGAVCLLMGNKATALTEQQINELQIDCYDLQEFDHDAFQQYYFRAKTKGE